MIDPAEFSRMQSELHSEFARHLIEHPELDEQLPPLSYVYFQLEGHDDFNFYSEALARKQQLEKGMTPVRIHMRGPAPLNGSRLIDLQVIAN